MPDGRPGTPGRRPCWRPILRPSGNSHRQAPAILRDPARVDESHRPGSTPAAWIVGRVDVGDPVDDRVPDADNVDLSRAQLTVPGAQAGHATIEVRTRVPTVLGEPHLAAIQAAHD